MPAGQRPGKAEILAAAGRTVPEVIAPGLTVFFCGINPGLYSRATGHHFARPGNRFWRALYEAGFMGRILAPWEERALLALGYGMTNLIARATASAAEISEEELRTGRRRLERKVQRHQPRWVAVLGILAYRHAFGQPRARIGCQPERLATSGLWVLPNPSGLTPVTNCRSWCMRSASCELRAAAAMDTSAACENGRTSKGGLAV